MSNYAAFDQVVESVPYRIGAKKGNRIHGSTERELLVDVSAVEEFASRFREDRKTQWAPAERLGGFCMLLKREVLRKIENDLDRLSDLSLFDTDVLSAKARQAGYQLAICRDLFIHHFGMRTFAHGAPAASNNGEATTGEAGPDHVHPR